MTADGAHTWQPVHFGCGTAVTSVSGYAGWVHAAVARCTSASACSGHRVYRSVRGSSQWSWSPGPESGRVNTAGGIGLAGDGAAVWLTVGNGWVPPRLFLSTDAGRSFRLEATVEAGSCGEPRTSARVAWLDCSRGMRSPE
jgi:hypothetical protein